MTKRSTNFNQWRKAGTVQDVADLFQMYGVTAQDLKEYQKSKAATVRKSYTCPQCGLYVESDVSDYDHLTTCPNCENVVVVGVL